MIRAEEDFETRVSRLERAIEGVEGSLAGEPLEAARTLVRAVLDVHRVALSDLLSSARDAGIDLPRELTRRPAIAWLLALHDLSPESVADRAEEAVRHAQGDARAGASAVLLGVDEGEVLVRLEGASREGVQLLRRGIERAVLRLVPEAVLSFQDPFGAVSKGDLLPAERLVRRPVASNP